MGRIGNSSIITGHAAFHSGVHAATRTMLLLADYCRGLGSYAEANYALMKAHFQVLYNRERPQVFWSAPIVIPESLDQHLLQFGDPAVLGAGLLDGHPCCD